MAEITAALVKQLRDKTGAGMMECKAALAEANGNIEEATTLLRKRGLAQAAKRAGRATAQGLEGEQTPEEKAILAAARDRGIDVAPVFDRELLLDLSAQSAAGSGLVHEPCQ